MRSAVIALLLLSTVAPLVRAGDETLWIEAENLDGVEGYCWPDGLKPKTNEHWGVSGPGWAPAWSQGGESNFMSIACGPDDDEAVAGIDVEAPVAGTYHIWVRFRDNRGGGSRFQVRLTSPDGRAGDNCVRLAVPRRKIDAEGGWQGGGAGSGGAGRERARRGTSGSEAVRELLGPEEIARVLATMDQIQPLELSDEERATLHADRQARKEWEKAHFDEHADKLRSMWP
jgi:hypothetical protein